MNDQRTAEKAELNELLCELESRTKAVDKTVAANMSDTAYVEALRAVQSTAARVVELNRAR